MVKYSCERCGKKFSQKSHYDSHNRRKTPCENNADKIKALVDKAVEEKLKELNKKLIVENKEVNVNTDTMEPHQSKQPNKFKIKKKKLKIVDNKFKFIDLFAGTGAFTLALEKSNKFKCVFTNDMMECSKKIYELNNPTHTFTLKDLNTINVSDNNLLYAVPYQHYTNAIEGYFNVLKSRLQKKKGLTYNELVKNVKDVLDEIPIHIYKNLIKGSYNRSEKFVKRPSTRKRKPKKYLD